MLTFSVLLEQTINLLWELCVWNKNTDLKVTCWLQWWNWLIPLCCLRLFVPQKFITKIFCFRSYNQPLHLHHSLMVMLRLQRQKPRRVLKPSKQEKHNFLLLILSLIKVQLKEWNFEVKQPFLRFSGAFGNMYNLTVNNIMRKFHLKLS